MAHAVRTLDEVKSQAIEQQVMTLLDLVTAIAEAASTDAEVVATVTHLLNSGKIKLIGNFRGADVRVR